MLSSILSSLEPPGSPPESLRSVDPREFDSQWESGYSDNDATPDLVPNKSRHFFQSGSGSSANHSSSFDDGKDMQEAANAAPSVNQVHINQHSSISDNDNAQDNSNSSDDSNDSDDDDDVDIDDEDVFDMLRDNSQIVIGMLNNTNTESEESKVTGGKSSTRGTDSLAPGNSLDATWLSDVPPPIPTTPLPSDDEEPPVKPPPRVESLPKYSANSKPVMNGTINGHDR